jgi:hypothetical protein
MFECINEANGSAVFSRRFALRNLNKERVAFIILLLSRKLFFFLKFSNQLSPRQQKIGVRRLP